MPQHPQTTTAPRRRRATALLTVAAATTLLAVPAAQAKTVTVTKAQSGKQLTLKVNDKLVIRLAENPSTGYHWGTIARPAILRLVSSRYVAPPVGDSGMPVPGAPGTRVYTYVARRTGSGTLRVRYTGPTGADGGRFTLRLVVK
jgi:inhibitor of cysteine peptidase